MMMDASARLFFEVVSAAPGPARPLALSAAAVLDAAGPLAPDRGAFSARMRRLNGGGLRGVFDQPLPKSMRDGIWLVYERRDAGLSGDVRCHDDTRLGTNPCFHSADFTLPVEAAQPGAPLHEAAVDLCCELFVAMRAFYGRIDSVAMRTHRLNLRSAAADDGSMWVPRWDDPRFVIYDRWIEDVWWITLFGPAFVERWGRATVDRLGTARRDLRNGGVAIWSAAVPPDPAASNSLSGYAHKQSFYDVLGRDTFIHETPAIPPTGLHVPLLEDHARFAAHAAPGA